MKYHLLVIALGASAAQARDTTVMVKISDVLNMPEGRSQLDGSVKFYFGKTHAPSGEARADLLSNKKTNAFNKSDIDACKWVTLSALIDLQNDAKKKGADAVVSIESFYKKKSFVSETEIECHAGTAVAGVALKGQAVKLGAPTPHPALGTSTPTVAPPPPPPPPPAPGK